MKGGAVRVLASEDRREPPLQLWLASVARGRSFFLKASTLSACRAPGTVRRRPVSQEHMDSAAGTWSCSDSGWGETQTPKERSVSQHNGRCGHMRCSVSTLTFQWYIIFRPLGGRHRPLPVPRLACSTPTLQPSKRNTLFQLQHFNFN